ncbi:hypothetical protein AURDEDRAFT_21737, partial [Auricularia subglabra TFB-10046 SS5]
GRILDQEATACTERMKAEVGGKLATGQCDGWKDICKASIVAFMMNVEYTPWLINTTDISRQAKDAENLFKLVLDEIKYATEVLKLTVVGWCTDASGESRKMRRLLVAKFKWMIVADCWAHQINLVVGDMTRARNFKGVLQDALDVVKWFNSHSRALGMLKWVTAQKLGKELSLILPVLTRWTSHYLSVRRLLALELPFRQLLLDSRAELERCAGAKRDAIDKALEILSIVEDVQFWVTLKSILLHLEPLARAANITQGDGARLDVVLVTLANLFHYFTSTPGLCADADVFLLALVFNPYIRLDCFADNSPFRTAGHIRQMAEAAFERFYGAPPGLDFANELVDYLRRRGHWSAESMNLKNEKERAKAEVNMLNIWRTWTPIADTEALDVLPASGAGRLALLATRVLSVVPNSAGTERIFSLFGFVHTKHRNRLSKDKVRKQVLVRVDTARQHGSGVSHSRKRKFGTDSDDEDDSRP